jgi:hypothetical protein
MGFGFAAVTIAQLVLFCGATWLLALETAAITRSALAASFVLLGTYANFELIKYCFMIQTESLATTCCMILLALLARFCRRPNVLLLLAMSTVAGLALLMRPAFAPLLIVPMLPLLSLRWPLTIRISALVTPAAVCILAGSLAHYSFHDFFGTQSFLGTTLIGEVGKIATGKIETKEPEIVNRLREPAEAIQLRQKMFFGFRSRFLVGEPYHDYLDDLVMPLVEQVAAAKGKRADDVALDAAIDIILAHPIGYLANTVFNLYALWYIPSLMTQREFDAYTAEFTSAKPLPLIGLRSHDFRARPIAIVFTGRLSLMLALVASVAAPIIWLTRLLRRLPLDPVLVAAAAAGVGVHGVFLLTALVQTGQSCLAVVMWPEMIFTIALLTVALSPWCGCARPEGLIRPDPTCPGLF